VDEGPSLFRLVAGLGVVVGLLTGLGTIVGWVASESFKDSVASAASYAGVAYIALGSVAGALSVREETTWPRRFWTGLPALIAPVALFFGVILPWDEAWLQGCAALGLLTAIIIGVIGLRQRQARIIASRKVCPDCAETVKAQANVCRYCGYRFRQLI
jgi:peptidoglycan/LPS O-acetylase OafA/YrhL